jgi:hypothetical protein
MPDTAFPPDFGTFFHRTAANAHRSIHRRERSFVAWSATPGYAFDFYSRGGRRDAVRAAGLTCFPDNQQCRSSPFWR